MSKRAILYARVSKDDRGRDSRNLQGQIDDCREYAQNAKYIIVAELTEDDRGASGADFDLPGIRRALELARAGEIDVLVTRELDRFARGLAKQLIVEQEFQRAGVDVEYVLEAYDDTPEGQLQKNVRAIIAEYEREKIKERMVRGRWKKVEAGNIETHGKAPYGYRLKTTDGKSVLVVDEQEAQIVKLIYDWYIGGARYYTIVTKLNAMGVPTWEDKHGKRKKKRRRGCWSVSTIEKILSSETYCGQWHYGKSASVDGKRVKRPRSEWLTVSVPAIVSREVWKRAQETKKKNSRDSKRNRKHNYLFGGYVTCGHCGLSLSGKAVKSGANTYLYYYCNGHRRETVRTCNSPKYRADIVDSEVWHWIRGVMSDPAELRRELENRRSECEKENQPLRDRLIVIRDLVSEQRSQLERLLDLYLSGEFQKDMLVDRKTRYEKTISALERERNRLIAELESNTLTSEQLQTIDEFASDVEQAFAVLDDNDFDEKREMIYRLGVQVRLSVEDDEKVARASSVVLGESPDLSVDSITTGSSHAGRGR